MRQHEDAAPFKYPVDPVLLGIPEYFDVIKEPMDFSTVEKHLRKGDYTTQKEFKDDVNKIFNNAMKFNDQNHEVFKKAQTLKAEFDKLCKMSPEMLNYRK